MRALLKPVLLKQARLLILDFDGTIIDTETADWLAWSKVAGKLNTTLGFSDFSRGIGAGDLFDPIQHLLEKISYKVSRHEIDCLWQQYFNSEVEGLTLRPGVATVLDSARRLRIPIAIASNSPRARILRHLTRLNIVEAFDCIKSSESVLHGKPAPDVYLSVLAHFGISASDSIALEDSPHGITSAKSAGIYCIAFPNDVTSRLCLSSADHEVSTLSDLPLSVPVAF